MQGIMDDSVRVAENTWKERLLQLEVHYILSPECYEVHYPTYNMAPTLKLC